MSAQVQWVELSQSMTTLEVYRKVLQQADQYRKFAEEGRKPIQGSWTAEQTWTALADALFVVAADLESTPEVNPPKK